MSIRDKVAAADDRQTEVVTIPEWDVTIELRSPTVNERADLIREFTDDDGRTDYAAMYAALVIATCHDPETGDKAFTAEDAAMLREKNGRVVNDLFEAAQLIAGLSPSQVEEDKKSVDPKVRA